MLQNVLERVSENVFQFVTDKTKNSKSLLVKKHTENLCTMGDFSIPTKVKSWHGFLNPDEFLNSTDSNVMERTGKSPNCLIEESRKWELPVDKVKIDQDRVLLFLPRPKVIRIGLLESMKNMEVITQKLLENSSVPVVCDPLCEDMNCVTSLRLKYLSKSIQNLYAISEKCRENEPKVFVTSKSSSKHDGSEIVLCGTVLNAKTGAKETTITADDFIRMRQEEMTLIAQHKYGVRVSTDAKWKEFIAHLGESAVAFELLQTKPSSAVKINFDCSSAGSSKGAAFILYNCARLETILRTFNDNVESGLYPPLPSFEETDLSLLTQEDEWTLIFNFILGLPWMLSSCVELDKHVEFRPHFICNHLCSMVRVFSQYYRKTRILTEPRKHLLPVLFARIHMLQALNSTLKACLALLNIKSVSQM